MKKIILTGIFAGLLVFAWANVSWMLLPWHMSTINHVANEKEVTEVLIKNTQTPNSKIYFLPTMKEGCKPATPTEPHIFIAFVPKHLNMMQHMLIGLLTDIITAILICLLIAKTTGLSYWSKVGLVTAIGLIIGINGYGAEWNWWGFAADYALVGIADSILSWLVGGLLIARQV